MVYSFAKNFCSVYLYGNHYSLKISLKKKVFTEIKKHFLFSFFKYTFGKVMHKENNFIFTRFGAMRLS